MKLLYKVPWTLILVLCWATARLFGAQLAASTVPGLIVIVAGFAALVIEFMRSSDITVRSFKMDLGMSIVALVTASVVTTCLFTLHRGLAFVDLVVWVVVFADAWSSPVNSFKTALRNITTDVGIGQQPPNEGGNQ
jgi:prolipoprotein diacylglyceryltransferase